jgi:trimeric autotransporter adhesin
MKRILPLAITALLLSIHSPAFAQGTAFTYQGRLNNGGGAANGLYDFRFKLYVDPFGNTQVGSSYLTNGVAVTNGLFITTIDFGAGIFIGKTNWLEVDVRTNGAGGYTDLNPLQQLAPTPYAVFAETASNLSGSLPAAQLSGTIFNSSLPASPIFSGAVTAGSFSGNGAGVANVNAATLNGLSASKFWQLGGNNVAAGQFLGSLNNHPMEIWVNGQRALHIESTTNTANIIGGWVNNFAAPGTVMATIGGGGGVSISLGTLNTNSVWSSYGTIGGGLGNQAGTTNDDPSQVRGATVGGGGQNIAGAHFSTISGGDNNTIFLSSDFSVIAGGYENNILINSAESVIAGGYENNILTNSFESVIAGGFNNVIQTNSAYSTIGGGIYNAVTNELGTVGGGDDNIAGNVPTVGGGLYNTASGTGSFIGGGGFDENDDEEGNLAAGGASVVGGGIGNAVNSDWATIGGGYYTSIQPDAIYSFIGGGGGNSIQQNAYYSFIGGGDDNVLLPNASYATIPGGVNNVATNFAFAAGWNAHAINTGAFVWSDSTGTVTTSAANNSVTFRASGGFRLFTGTGSGGATLAAGATSWTTLSDRNAKKNFEPVDTVAVVDKLAAIPIQQWNYKWEKNDDVPNIGPMAQDFKHAFYPGRDDKGISTLEFDGVELAAIQGLNQKLEEQTKKKDMEIQDLKKSVDELKALVKQLAQNQSK